MNYQKSTSRWLYLCGTLMCLISSFAQAQTADEVLLWTDEQVSVTARSMGMGDVLGSISEDFSAIYSNPAGLGKMKAIDLTLSLGNRTSYTQGDVIFGAVDNGLIQGGMAVPLRFEKGGLVKGLVFTLGYHRVAAYGRKSIRAKPHNRNIVQKMLAQAEGTLPENLDPYSTGAFLEAGLMRHEGSGMYAPISDTIGYYSSINESTFRHTGGSHALSFSTAISLGDRFWVGLVANLATHHYARADASFDDYVEYVDFSSYSLNYRMSRSSAGLGFGGKIGLQAAPTERLTIGLTVQAPTFYTIDALSDIGLNGMLILRHRNPDSSSIENFDIGRPSKSQRYTMMTPWRFSASVGLQIGARKRGLVGFEASYWDAGSTRLASVEEADYFEDLTQAVRARYTGVLNLKIGTENPIGDSKAFYRLGYHLQTSPHRSEPVDGATGLLHHITAGIGWHWKQIHMDYALGHSRGSYLHQRPFFGLESDVRGYSLALWRIQGTLRVLLSPPVEDLPSVQ